MKCILLPILLMFAISPVCKAAEPLVVHEWGTFTSLQDEDGNALGRINTDDESVPAFVHQMAGTALFPATQATITDGKGVPAGDPNVTMRLETPVIYFHVPQDQSGPLSVDVNVTFHGGFLSQYYPDAQPGIDGAAKIDAASVAGLSAKSVGRLAWKALQVNSTQGVQPKTEDRVWTSPRAVASAPLSAGAEREQFLFYRGVGHVDAPVRVTRDVTTGELRIRAASTSMPVEKLWLVDTRADGVIAFREILAAFAKYPVPAAAFEAGDYREGNLAELRRSMHEALVGQGLFADEADALLNTWQNSYFKNPGERLFFMVPSAWTDETLPLTLSVPAKVTRVMVGRIEIVTPEQRRLLHKMALQPASAAGELKEVTAAMTKLRNDPKKAEFYNALASGRGDLNELGVKVPVVYADFLALGRFRAALVWDAKADGPILMGLAGYLAE